MMIPFVKIYQTILKSSIWAEPSDTRIVWLTLLVSANSHGYVRSSFSGLVRTANVSPEAVKSALEALSAPDIESGSQEWGGRRIEMVDGGWQVLNHQRYRLQGPDGDGEEEQLPRGEGYVYYARAGNVVKIGFSRNPWARVTDMRTARPNVQLVGLERGTLAVERARHEEFAAAHQSREWFRWTPEIASHVETVTKVRAQNKRPPTEKSTDPAEAQHRAEATRRNAAARARRYRERKRHAFTTDPTTDATTASRGGALSVTPPAQVANQHHPANATELLGSRDTSRDDRDRVATKKVEEEGEKYRSVPSEPETAQSTRDVEKSGASSWTTFAAQTIRNVCYAPDGVPPTDWDVARDLRWWRHQVEVRQRSPERIAAALRGVVQLVPSLAGTKWRPAQVFSKRGDWADLFERSLNATEKVPRGKRAPSRLGDVLQAAQASVSTGTNHQGAVRP